MWTEKCKSITNIYQIAIKKYTCALTERLVLSSVNTYSPRIFIQRITKINPTDFGWGLFWSCSDLQNTEKPALKFRVTNYILFN